MTEDRRSNARRQFLSYVLASPLLASSVRALAEDGANVIETVQQALNVFDFEAVAKRTLPPAHWGYLATGVDDDATIKANREGFTKFALRARRMVDISKVDMSVSLFGAKFDSPIVLSPVSSQQAFHAEGEIGVAKAARKGNHLQMLSTLTSFAVEEVIAARGSSVWFQLYPTDQWDVTAAVLKRVHAAGCPAVAVTVDLNPGSNRETMARAVRADSRDCTVCHTNRPQGGTPIGAKAMFQGIDMSRVRRATPTDMTWDSVKRLRDLWPGKLLLKGIVTKEDGALAVRHGLDGIVVSNHGGRAEESVRSTIESLGEVIAGTRRKIPVVVDSGFRRGTDILKALALGANAVGVGRPYIWGLAAFGEPGVEAVLRILREELLTAMRHVGARSIAEITPTAIVPR
jgi:4-hydroxymandelate oxidase